MPEAFQRIFQRTDFTVQSLSVQAALGPARPPKRSQFSLLVRHFLERFFNHETASSTGDGKTRMVQIACVTGLPGLMVAVYLWPIYHPVIIYPPRHDGILPGPPPYWVQANHHFFFVIYSFVAMGLITVFQWDLFFPDLLDVFVLSPLPIPQWRMFLARAGAIGLLVGAVLLDANLLAWLILPVATDPPSLAALLTGHALAVVLAGLFSAGLVLALQGTLLAVFGEKLVRRISLMLQGTMVAAFLLLLLLFPVLSGVTPGLLQSDISAARWFPPFWFLGVYQQQIPDAATLPAWNFLARTGFLATAAVWAVALAAYPLAHLRRVRALVQGSASRTRPLTVLRPFRRLQHAVLLRPPLRRAVFHFISQTILRVPRYRIYLILYCGVGLSLVIATILRLDVRHGHLEAGFSADGFRVAIGIIAFWVVAGLRSAFVSPGNQNGGWIFRSIQGRPPAFPAACHQLEAATLWVFLAAATVSVCSIAAFQLIAPAELRTWPAIAAQLLTALGLSLLLSDGFFLNVTTVPFTGARSSSQDNLAFSVLRYYTFFPLVTVASMAFEFAMERGGARLGIAVAVIAVIHLWLRRRHRESVRLECGQVALDDDEDDFPMRLGLRY